MDEKELGEAAKLLQEQAKKGKSLEECAAMLVQAGYGTAEAELIIERVKQLAGTPDTAGKTQAKEAAALETRPEQEKLAAKEMAEKESKEAVESAVAAVRNEDEKKLKDTKLAIAEQQARATSAAEQKPEKKGMGKGKKIAIVIVVVLLLLAIGLAAYILLLPMLGE